AVLHDGEREAGIDAPAVHQHRAGAALTMIAPLLGAAQRKMVPQGVEQRGPGHEIERVTDAIDDKMDRNAFGNLMRDIAHALLPATATVPDVSRVDAGARRLRRSIAPNGPPAGWFLAGSSP